MSYEVTASSYSVGLIRAHAKKSVLLRRFLRLYDLVQVSGPPLQISQISGVGVAFFERMPKDFGTFTANGIVNVRAHLSDFEDLYHIVQSEAQLHFIWTEGKPGSGEIASYTLNIPSAPVGG